MNGFFGFRPTSPAGFPNGITVRRGLFIRNEKVQNSAALYDRIVTRYAGYPAAGEARENISEFNRVLPEYAMASGIEKTGCLPWSRGIADRQADGMSKNRF